MPRANRIIQPNCIYHLTQRCHNRAFLFKFSAERDRYQRHLREKLQEHGIPLLNYCITSNHVHLLVVAESRGQLANFMKETQGEYAQAYNRRTQRSGAFWGDRYHATMVEEGMYLARCMRYIDLNMIRAGVVDDPLAWKWTGYAELMGEKKRNRLIDFSEVLRRSGHSQRESFQIYYAAGLAELIEQGNARQAEWTECLAVGSKNYVEYIESRLTERSRFVRQVSVFDATRWTLKEPIFGYRAASRG